MVGERAAQLLAARFGSMERLLAATEADINEIHGIGPQIAQAVTRFFAEPRNRATIERLGRAGVVMSEEGATEGPRPLDGKAMVLTGGLRSLTRDQAKDLVIRLGGRVTGSVSKKTDYVVVGEDAGTKADDASRLGVRHARRGGIPQAGGPRMRAPTPALGSPWPSVALCPRAAAAAQDRPPPTREQALADIKKPEVEARRHAAAGLGEVGAIADAPALLRALRDQDEVVRTLAEHSVWQVWSRSGDPEMDALFQQGIEQMSRGKGAGPSRPSARIIRKKPDFAEGWNKRATVYFLIGEYEKSLNDCDEVMKRNPEHFGVLAGYGQIYLQLDQPERALDYFQRALAVNPNLRQVEIVIEQLERLIVERRKGTI